LPFLLDFLLARETEFFNDFVRAPVCDLISKKESVIATGGDSEDKSYANALFIAHDIFVNTLIWGYLSARFPKDKKLFPYLVKGFNKDLLQKFGDINPLKLGNIFDTLHLEFFNSEHFSTDGKWVRVKTKHKIRALGVVYTPRAVAAEIVRPTIDSALASGIDVKMIRCLDFAAGSGVLYIEALKQLEKEYGADPQHAVKHNLFAVDIDATALAILRLKVIDRLGTVSKGLIDSLNRNVVCENALMPKAVNGSNKPATVSAMFGAKRRFRFDAIFSNPPYGIVKINRRSSTASDKVDDSLKAVRVKREIEFFRESGIYRHTTTGTMNYYRLSIEVMLHLLNSNGSLGVICPATLFADLTATPLRRHLLLENTVQRIRLLPESFRIFNGITQATVIWHLRKGSRTTSFKYYWQNRSTILNMANIKKCFPENLEVPAISSIAWGLLRKLSRRQTLGSIEELRNRRGEVDLTLDRHLVTKTKTEKQLVRGKMLGDVIRMGEITEYVDVTRLKETKSDEYFRYDFDRVRLVGPQISNMAKSQRLKFVKLNGPYVLANSCNYISTRGDRKQLAKLLFLLNSKLLDWRFKATSTNNHINNYEIDQLPIIELEKITPEMLRLKGADKEECVCNLYDLNQKEKRYICDLN
jgi:adenine-specific DNA-methyltransferase